MYENHCELNLDDILLELPTSREPVFYDMYLQTGTNSLYPVPIKIKNYDTFAGNTNENAGGWVRVGSDTKPISCCSPQMNNEC